MNMDVLISCMYQNDLSIIERTQIQSNVIVINQCNKNETENFTFNNLKGDKCFAKFISTTERGLSKSRNMALINATSDICLICDDDEILDEDYPDKILSAFRDNPDTDIIAFQISNAGKEYPVKKKKIGYLGALKLASWQLAFRRKSIIDNGIKFDETLGSGVSKAGGEENMFIYDCIRKGLRIAFIPHTIGKMIESGSQWFHGCSPEFFFDKGKLMTKLLGKTLSVPYAFYYLITKHHWYKKDISMFFASKYLFTGIFKNTK